MSESADLLSQLRDVREPLPPDGVSLWLIVANAAVLVLIILLLWRLRQQRRQAWRKQFIQSLRLAYDKPAEQAIGIAATVLRQLLLYRGYNIETLSGESWLEQLDCAFDTRWFTTDKGRIFGEALYKPQLITSDNATQVLQALEKMIHALPAADTTQVQST